jgi:hypothetical protein
MGKILIGRKSLNDVYDVTLGMGITLQNKLEMIQKSCNKLRRTRACVRANGAHFEYLL